MFFTIGHDRCIQWIERDQSDEMPTSEELGVSIVKMSKQAQAAEVLKVLLKDEPMKSSEVQALFKRENISEKTLLLTKKNLGIRSVKRDGVWYWLLPSSDKQEGD